MTAADERRLFELNEIAWRKGLMVVLNPTEAGPYYIEKVPSVRRADLHPTLKHRVSFEEAERYVEEYEDR